MKFKRSLESVGSVNNILDSKRRLYQESLKDTGEIESKVFLKHWNLTQTFKVWERWERLETFRKMRLKF